MGYKIVTEMKVMGIVISYDRAECINKNFKGYLVDIDKTLNIWKMRNLSILGKVQIIKTFGLSKILFVTNMLNTPKEIIKEANTIFHKFLWNGPDKIKRTAIISEINHGGIKMPDLESEIKNQKKGQKWPKI